MYPYQRNVFRIGALGIEMHRETYLKELGIHPRKVITANRHMAVVAVHGLFGKIVVIGLK